MGTAAVALEIDREKLVIEDALRSCLRANAQSPASSVALAMEYAVLGGGQRLRPLLALRAGALTGADPNLVLRGAVAVELLHCASLIVDDLPCMDNESFRRGMPTVHRQFGESTALLAAFSLVALAARQMVDGIRDPALLARLVDFQRKVLGVLDCNSLVGGQAMDLSGAGSSRQLAEKKTAPLFSLAALAGLIAADVDPFERQAIFRFGHEFGVSYQLLDDMDDGELGHRGPFETQLERTRSILSMFGIRASGLMEMTDWLYGRSLT